MADKMKRFFDYLIDSYRMLRNESHQRWLEKHQCKSCDTLKLELQATRFERGKLLDHIRELSTKATEPLVDTRPENEPVDNKNIQLGNQRAARVQAIHKSLDEYHKSNKKH